MSKLGPLEGGAIAERLRQFVQTLSEATCIQLLEGLDKAALAGNPVPGTEIIAAHLRTRLGDGVRKRPRPGTPSRLFFRILEPMLIDEELSEKRPARIERSSLGALWVWLQRTLIPEQTKAYEDACAQAILIDDLEAAKAAALEFQKHAITAIRQAIDTEATEVERRRMISQLGGQRVFDDVKDILVIFEHRDALKALSDRVVGPIRSPDEAQIAFIGSSLTPYARSTRPSLLPYAAAIVMSKMVQPWLIVRVAATLCETDEARRIAETPYAALIELALTDIERMVVRATNARRSLDTAKVLAAARDFSAYVRSVSSDIDPSSEHAWVRRLGHARGRMGELLRTQVETLPGRVRWLIKPAAGDSKSSPAADSQEIEAIELALDILVLAKNHAAEFAMNEVTLRVHTDLQGLLDSGMNPLIEGARNAKGEDRDRRLVQLEAAVRIAAKIFGANYAGLLQKAIEVATGSDKKPTKAA